MLSAKRFARRDRAARAGFTLIEAITALAITAMAASVVLLAMETSITTSADSVNQAIAQGLADQILDEVLGSRYCAPDVSPYQYPLGPNAFELGGNARERFDDVDDFHNYQAQPAEDRFGQRLGQGDGAGKSRHPSFRVPSEFFARWRVSISVTYVAENDLSTALPAGNVSDFRAVEVTIAHLSPQGDRRVLARARRVVAYIPPPEGT